MKKALSVFIMILLIVCTVFAESEVRVRSVVKNAYTINQANTDSAGGLYKLCVNKDDVTPEASSYILVDADISQENVSVDFVIRQQQMTMTNEAIVISVEAGQLSYTDIALGQTFSTTEFSFSEVGDPSVGEEYLEIVSETREENLLVFSLRYKDSKHAVERGTTIATFTANWAKNEDLAEHPGTYTADLTLKYTVN